MGHKQPPTPVQIDDTMAEGVINKKIQPKRNHAMEMRFHWIRDRECHEQFRIYWRPGKKNYAGYWKNYHADKHHKNIWREFLTPYIVLEMIQQVEADAKRSQWDSSEGVMIWGKTTVTLRQLESQERLMSERPA